MKTLAAVLPALLLASSALGAATDPLSERYQKAAAAAQDVCSSFALKAAARDLVENAGCEASSAGAVTCEKPPKNEPALLGALDAVVMHARDAASALQSNCPWQLYTARAQAAQAAVNAAKKVDPLERNECRNALSLVTEKQDLSAFYALPTRRAQALAADYLRRITRAETLCSKAVTDASNPAKLALDQAKLQALQQVNGSDLSPGMKLAFEEKINGATNTDLISAVMSGSFPTVSREYAGQSPNDYYKAKVAALQPAITALGDDAFRVQAPLNSLNALIAGPVDVGANVPGQFDTDWYKLSQAMEFAQTAAKNTASLKAAFTTQQTAANATINALRWIGDPSRADFLSQIAAQSSALNCNGQCWTPWQNALSAAETQLTAIVSSAQKADSRYQSYVFNADNMIGGVNTTGNPAVTADQKTALIAQIKTFQGQIQSSTLAQLQTSYAALLHALTSDGVYPRNLTPEE
ncbi:MAG TPA: hypothetical protein VN915_06565 [Elusimicrobiota bacterium]|nr:hypothetical protein [Elusimicrobiota bacterium]